MENLRRKVFNELNNYPIASTNQSSSTTSPLETTWAYNISWAFFKNMVDPVCDRVHAIIHAHASLSAVQAATAKTQHQDSATPEVVGDMDRTLAALLGTDAKTKAISTLRHQIELYRLDKRWGDIKRLVSDSPLTPEGASFLSGCPLLSRRKQHQPCHGGHLQHHGNGQGGIPTLPEERCGAVDARPGLGSWRHHVCSLAAKIRPRVRSPNPCDIDV